MKAGSRPVFLYIGQATGPGPDENTKTVKISRTDSALELTINGTTNIDIPRSSFSDGVVPTRIIAEIQAAGGGGAGGVGARVNSSITGDT